VRLIYSGLAKSVFGLERVKYSSYDCPSKIPVDSNARYFTSFSTGGSSNRVAKIFPALHLVYVIAWV
jgi:hypothetical protein